MNGIEDEGTGLAAATVLSGSQHQASANDVETISAALMTKMVVKFQALKWVGSVEVKGVFSSPVLSSSFFVQGQFGGIIGSSSVEETTVLQPDEKERAKWWSKKLKEKLKYMKQKIENIAYGLKDFRLTGRLGVIFNLLAPTILTAGITLGFEIKIEVLTESIIGSITTEEWSQRMREKVQRKLQKQKARQGSCGLLEKVAPCVAKRIEDRKERRLQRIGSENELLTDDEMRAREKERDDIAIEKMMLSLQATKMKIDSLGWIGFARVQIDLGLLSVYLQVNFFRVATQLAFDVESTLAAKKELEEKRAEDPQISAGKSSAASKPAIIGTYRSGSGSSTDLAPQEAKKNEHEAADDSEEERKRRGGGESAPVVAKEDNEWAKAWSRIVALVDLPDKSEEDSTTAEQLKAVQKAGGSGGSGIGAAGKREREGLRERGFKKGLELGINSINKVSKANFKGIHAGAKVGASFSFTVLGFGIQTSLEAEVISVRTS